MPSGSLPVVLQQGGVRTRWITDHRNGTPEGSEAQAHDYRGLRSLLLTEKYAWLPLLAGAGILRAFAHAAGPGARPQAVLGDIPHYFNGRHVLPYDNVLVGYLLPQLREMQSRGGSTMTIFHADWRLAIRNRLERPTRASYKALRASPDVSPDYRYDSSLAELVAQSQRPRSRNWPRPGGASRSFSPSCGPIRRWATRPCC